MNEFEHGTIPRILCCCGRRAGSVMICAKVTDSTIAQTLHRKIDFQHVFCV
jgi:hypothetical protein